jgi:hypothetical protein
VKSTGMSWMVVIGCSFGRDKACSGAQQTLHENTNIEEIASLFEYKTPTKKLEQVMFNDLEKDGVEVNYVHGYPSLAAIIASDSSAAIYRRFDRLSARTLLYMQSELSELESELETLERADLHNLEDGANEPHRDWNLFKAKAEDPDNEKWRQRMALVKEIQEKLKIYRGYTIARSCQ